MTLLGHGSGVGPALRRVGAGPTSGVSGARGARSAPHRRRWPVIIMLASVIAAAAYVLPRGRGLGEHVAAFQVPAREVHPLAAVQAPAREVSREAIDSERGRIVDPEEPNAAPPTAVPDRSSESGAAAGAPPAIAGRAIGPTREASSRPERTHPHAHRKLERAAPDAVVEPPADLVQATPPPTKAVALAPTPLPDRSEATRLTRWQSMDQTLAACSGGFFERVLCRQRVRITFCDGYWGSVPQCATTANDDVR